MINFIIYLINSILIFSNFFYIKRYLHIYQLKNYQNLRFFEFFSKKHKIYIILLAFFVVLQIFFKNFYIIIGCNIFVFISNLLLNKDLMITKKTPLTYTSKLNRLFAISIFLIFIPLFIYCGFTISSILLFISPCLSNSINIYDKILNKKFIKKAQKKLQKFKPKIIAITGSNGKTSVKNILYKMLSSLENVLVTPKSFNTPLGIAKFINENLKEDCKYLILEYGARRRNDIKTLCKLFGADYGIITLIGNQHLQTFKSRENIYLAKSELSKYLKENLCVYNLDNIYALRMYQEKCGEKIGVSCNEIKDKFNPNIVYATNIKIVNYSTTFILHIANTSYSIKTKLLGEHNVLNILLSSALAFNLGMPIQNIISAINSLEFTPHRLELIQSRINILDDSYNCSIDSARASLNVLSQLKNKKAVATPGIIEGGNDEYKLNFQLGKMISNFDYAIIIGEHNKIALENGITNKKSNIKIYYAKTLEDAKKYFNLLHDGDNLLLLNDLPDDYK